MDIKTYRLQSYLNKKQLTLKRKNNKKEAKINQ